jgi:hypothetical protein
MPVAVGLGLVLLAALPGIAAAASTVVDSERFGRIEIRGVGCGTFGSEVVPLPEGATDVNPRRPRVGAQGPDSRITEVVAEGAGVRITAVGEGEDLCDPEADPDFPPEQRVWASFYEYWVTFRERVEVSFWAGAGVARARPRARPRRIEIPFVATASRIRWRTFGGRRAIGFGRIKVDEPPGFRCTPRQCPGHGRRMKIVLTRPSRCLDIDDTVYYGRIAFHATRRIGFIRNGGLFARDEPSCALSEPRRV